MPVRAFLPQELQGSHGDPPSTLRSVVGAKYKKNIVVARKLLEQPALPAALIHQKSFIPAQPQHSLHA